MPIRPVELRLLHPRRSFHVALLASVSALTLVAAVAPAQARSPGGSYGAAASAVANATAQQIAASQQAQIAATNAQYSLARATRANQRKVSLV